MRKIALISCHNMKKNGFNFIKDIDRESQLFKLSMDYAKKLADEVFIITPKYGLIKESNFEYYPNDSVEFRGEVENRLWSLGILDQLNRFTDIHKDEYIILANSNYYRNYSKFLKKVNMPLDNMNIEETISFLKQELDKDDKISDGEKFHILFNSMKRYNYDNFDEIPFTNGIYVVLDKKEKYKDMDRIVRIGSHDSDNKLIKRIKNHYKNGFKDSSFFRKNIGKSILSYNDHDYLYIWNINFNDKINQCKYGELRDMEVEGALEEKISEYMKDRFEIVCFEVEDLKERYRIEEGLISTICHDKDFNCSDNWLGKYSPVEEIRDSNMWVAKGLDVNMLSTEECRMIVNLCLKSNEESEELSKV